MAIAHFAVGATCTLLVITYLVPGVRYPRALPLLGGVWAMVPDAYWAAPALRPALRPLHQSMWSNVFWFHHALDGLDPSNSRTVAAATVVALVVATVLAERREYRALERIRAVAGTE